jgi:uncharacterized protein (TIGR04255 family)
MHYEKAPITEALIDIQVEMPASFSFEQLNAIKALVSDDYPHPQQRQLGQAQFLIGPELKASTTNKPFGIQFFSPDRLQVFQANVNGFAFSRLEPYQSWEFLRDEARRLWAIYRATAMPTRITRMAVRYINQFHFPAVTSMEPDDYLNTFPELSKWLPEELRGVSNFSMTLHLPQTDLGATLIVNEALSGPAQENSVPIILDLDLFVDNPALGNDSDMWNLFERLRERKNLYFEACITDKTRELIR